MKTIKPRAHILQGNVRLRKRRDGSLDILHRSKLSLGYVLMLLRELCHEKEVEMKILTDRR